MTAFNDERFLDDCLDSVRRQSYADWRIVVVDDASTDATAAVAARHARDDDRIEVVRHGVNAGLSAARNSGLLRATSPWVCFLDGDDFLLEASLADRVAVLAAANDRDDVAGSFAGWITVAEDARLAEFPARVDGDVSDFEDLLTTAGACPFPAHAPLLRTEVLLAAGGFDETMRVGAEDWDAWLRLMRSGYQFIGSGSRTVAYRMKRASMVGRDPAGHLEVGKGLLDSVHRPAVPASLIPGGPAALDVTLSELIRSVEHARRTLSFAPFISVGDPERAEATVREVAPRSWRLLEWGDDLAARIVTAARRAEQTHPAGADADQLIADVTRWVDEARSGGSVIDSDALDVAVLAVPSNAAEVDEIASTAEPTLWLVLDRDEGPHGVGDAVAARGLPAATLSALSLGGRWARPDQVVVGSWPTAAAARLAADPHARWADVAGASLASLEEYPEHRCDGEALASLRDRHAGERAIIIGNGPSLRETNLSLLADEVTFGVNGIFYAREEMGFDPTYYVVEDTSVMRENLSAIHRQSARQKFFPSMYRDLYDGGDALFFNLNRGFYERRSPNVGVPRFSVDAAQRVYAGQSVTYVNLQLAFHMGFTSVVLIGVDFDYVIPDDAERNGELLTSRGPDPNHFHPNYFGAGKTWKDPRLDRVAQNYELARAMFEAAGREIVNATVGGKLEIFRRVELEAMVR